MARGVLNRTACILPLRASGRVFDRQKWRKLPDSAAYQFLEFQRTAAQECHNQNLTEGTRNTVFPPSRNCGVRTRRYTHYRVRKRQEAHFRPWAATAATLRLKLNTNFGGIHEEDLGRPARICGNRRGLRLFGPSRYAGTGITHCPDPTKLQQLPNPWS